MPRPIKITEDIIVQLQKEFAEAIRKQKLFNGKLSYSKSFKYEKENNNATVEITPTAFAKMISLVMEFDDEVAWHGEAYRKDDDEKGFIIKDILVYPQEVTGATVEMNTEEYAQWITDNYADERFYNIRMQGHSHVKMGVSPSSQDLEHQKTILDQLDDDMFYIFMIWNKNYKSTTVIFDLKNNTVYDNEDIILTVGGEPLGMNEFISQAKEQVVKRAYTYTYNKKTSSQQQKGASSSSSVPQVKEKGKKISQVYQNYIDDYEDYYNRFGL